MEYIVAENRMLRWIRGNTSKYHVRYQVIQEDTKVCQMSSFLRQKRVNWYGHMRREEDNVSRKMIDMAVPGTRRRERPRRRWLDSTREYMKKYLKQYLMTGDVIENRQYWKMIVKTDTQRSGEGLYM